jgi:biotin carboxyl carrier protein
LVNLIAGTQKFKIEESDGTPHTRIVLVNGRTIKVEVLNDLGRAPVDLLLRAGDRTLHITVGSRDDNDRYSVDLNGRPVSASLELFDDLRLSRGHGPAVKGPVLVTAPMAGRIASLKTSVGKAADEGQALVVLEAMKMENEVASPKKGLVKEVFVQPGALVKAGDKLVLVE